ncbi:MAG: leucyl/phenylalanyl-tRNA--protein transferase, partial [Gammaproteobacteria bacterium]|nr:leucyl/phenylalanyl-tRNA--protein transferase [Gammaproteobacteria bacterium]
MAVSFIQSGISFPDAQQADDSIGGLLAVGGDLSPKRLLAAYRAGIFPWFDDDQAPVLWWSPDPRAVLVPGEMRISRSLAKRLRNGGFEVSFDRAFAEVVNGCATEREGQSGTWITPGMGVA